MMTHETTVDCVEFRDLITDYLEEALSPAMTLGVEQHRQTCESCEEFLGQIRFDHTRLLGSLNRQRARSLWLPKSSERFSRMERVSSKGPCPR